MIWTSWSTLFKFSPGLRSSDYVGLLNELTSLQEVICALRNEALSSSRSYKKRLWPQRDAAVQLQYLGTQWHTNDAGKHHPHDTTTSWYSWHQNGFMLFTHKCCAAISMLQQKPGFVRRGSVLSLLDRSLLPIATRRSMIFLFSAAELCMILGFWCSSAPRFNELCFLCAAYLCRGQQYLLTGPHSVYRNFWGYLACHVE